MNPSEFAAQWSGSTRNERAASQEHFIDLCRMLGEATPNQADPTGEWYAFEKGAEKTGGGDGFADVWKRGHFAWEYKGQRHDLAAAYRQLLELSPTESRPGRPARRRTAARCREGPFNSTSSRSANRIPEPAIANLDVRDPFA